MNLLLYEANQTHAGMDRNAPDIGPDTPSTTKKIRLRPSRRSDTSPRTVPKLVSPTVPATPSHIKPPDPPSKMPFQRKDELLRLTHDLSRARANLARYQGKYTVATKFLEEIQCVSASCASTIDTAQEINRQLDWSKQEWDKAVSNGIVPGENLIGLYNCSQQARQLNEDSLTLCRKHCERLEQACKTFAKDRHAIEQDHCRLIGLRSRPTPEG